MSAAGIAAEASYWRRHSRCIATEEWQKLRRMWHLLQRTGSWRSN